MKPKQQKLNEERDIDEFEYESSLDWRFMKSLRSETQVRNWHIKIATGELNEKEKPIYDNYCIAQSYLGRDMNGLIPGETLIAYKAKKSGRPEDISKMLFKKGGEDWLQGLEYLLRFIEGEDISTLNLRYL